jgi:hypothetical protein
VVVLKRALLSQMRAVMATPIGIEERVVDHFLQTRSG